MKRTVIVALAIYWLLIIGTTIAQAEELNQQHQTKQGIFHGVTVGDAVTTIIGAGCVAVKEVNPILQGASPVGIVGFFVARNVIHQKITESIPEHWRDAWLNTSIGAQSLVVLNNVAVLAKYC
jgi:hypothetical protein